MNNVKRICLWSGPRNISTALMYSFAQRADTKVFDEPLYGFYLNQTEAKNYHPGADETIAELQLDGEKVVRQMMTDDSSPVFFFKNMAHHLLDLDKSFLKKTVNLILTREPKDAILSFSKVIENPTFLDLGYEDQLNLKQEFEKMDAKYLVINSTEILENPEKALAAICDLAEIPFEEKMLHWEAGARPEDGSWAKHWYTNVHQSTGFRKYSAKSEEIPVRLQPLLAACNACYSNLIEG
jgi:hypothetical protein